MNRQASFISWLAFPCALIYAWLRTWDVMREFARGLIRHGRIAAPDLASLGAGVGEDTLWRLGLTIAVAVMMVPWARKFLLFCRILHPDGAFTENTALLLNVIGRWLIAACLILWNSETGAMLFSSIFAAVLIVPEATALITAGFTGFIDSLFFPGSREKKPPYTLKLARFYVQKQRWEDAEAEYARMRSFYPDRLEAWQESLRTAFALGDDADPPPEKILSKGLRKLKAPAEKEALFATFKAREKPVILPEVEDF